MRSIIVIAILLAARGAFGQANITQPIVYTATVGGGLVKGGTAGAPSFGLIRSCTLGQQLVYDGTNWGCALAGDITSVGATAGGGLTGGATSGPALLSLITTCDPDQLLKWSGSAWGCADDEEGSSGITNSAGNNVLTKSDGTNLVASSASDDGTTFTIDETAVVTHDLFAQSFFGVDGGATVGGQLGVGLTSPTTIDSGNALFPSATPKAEILTGTSNGTYNDLVVIRHNGIDGGSGAGTRRLGLMMKLDGDFDTGSSHKQAGILAESSLAFGNSPSLFLVAGDSKRVEIDSTSGTVTDFSHHVVNGNLTVKGSATWGDSTSDTHVLVGKITANTTTATTGQVLKADASGLPKWSSDNDILRSLSCTANQIAKWDGVGSWACAADNDSGGDITGISTTGPLSGGCTSGTCSLTTSMATSRILGRVTASTGVAEELTGTQTTALLDLASSSSTTKGLVPGGNGGGSGQYLGADLAYHSLPSAGITGSLTSGFLPVATGSTSAGDSHLKDDGMNVYVMSSAGGGSAKVTIAEATGNVSIGSTIVLTATTGGIVGGGLWRDGNGVYLDEATKSIGVDYLTNGSSTLCINCVGYAAGTTQFRDTKIGDGKNSAALTITGSTKAAEFAGAATINGSTTAGDADSDYLNARGTLAVSGTDASTASSGCSVSGEAQSFQITLTSEKASSSTCVIAFNRTLNSSPYCVISHVGGSAPTTEPTLSSSTTTATLTMQSTTPISNVWNVWCPDRR